MMISAVICLEPMLRGLQVLRGDLEILMMMKRMCLAPKRSGGLDEEQVEVTRMPNAAKYIVPKDHKHPRQVAGVWGYVFQIMFQMQAGAVVLTDCVFWFIMVPFLSIKDYNLKALIIIMHSINVVFLIGATALNSLRFPWFRIAYFVLWTCVFVVFQWIVHACYHFGGLILLLIYHHHSLHYICQGLLFIIRVQYQFKPSCLVTNLLTNEGA